eukprot:195184_1
MNFAWLIILCNIVKSTDEISQLKLSRNLLSQNINWTLATNSTLPYHQSGSAIAYYNNTIYILGIGLITYHITNNSFVDHGNIANGHSIDGDAQYYAQQNNILYIIDDRGTSISIFNLSTTQFIRYWSTIPNNTFSPGCLSANDEYLFTITTPNIYKALNLYTNTWLTNLPVRVDNYRNNPACVVHRNELYVIAGHQRDSFEKIFIGNNLNTQIWKLYDNALKYSVWGHRAIIIHDDIWIIGGWDDLHFKKWVDAIQIIHIDTSQPDAYSYSSGGQNGYLAVPVFKTAVILAHDVLYAFGGETGIDGNFSTKRDINTWQYIDLYTTDAPTINPTFYPTNPTIQPTIYPIIQTTVQIVDSTVYYSETMTQDNSANINDSIATLKSLFEITISIIIIVFILIAIIGCIDARFLRVNDFYYISFIGQALLQILDLISDCFLSVDISLRSQSDNKFKIALIVSIIFIVMPCLLSLIQVYYYSRKYWNKYNSVREWLLTHSKWLYILSILTGSSFSAIEILNSSFLGVYCFEMGLSNKQIILFKTQRVYSIIMLENIPQLVLQIWYMFQLGKSDNFIAIVAIIFSGISIIVTILSMTIEKSLLNSQEYTLLSMDVIGKSVVEKSRKCRKTVRKIKEGISGIIGLDYELIDIVKPQTIPKGLQLNIHLYVDNKQSKENKYEDLFNDALKNKNLVKIISDTWCLSSTASILNLKCVNIQNGKPINTISSQDSNNPTHIPMVSQSAN